MIARGNLCADTIPAWAHHLPLMDSPLVKSGKMSFNLGEQIPLAQKFEHESVEACGILQTASVPRIRQNPVNGLGDEFGRQLSARSRIICLAIDDEHGRFHLMQAISRSHGVCCSEYLGDGLAIKPGLPLDVAIQQIGTEMRF